MMTKHKLDLLITSLFSRQSDGIRWCGVRIMLYIMSIYIICESQLVYPQLISISKQSLLVYIAASQLIHGMQIFLLIRRWLPYFLDNPQRQYLISCLKAKAPSIACAKCPSNDYYLKGIETSDYKTYGLNLPHSIFIKKGL